MQQLKIEIDEKLLDESAQELLVDEFKHEIWKTVPGNDLLKSPNWKDLQYRREVKAISLAASRQGIQSKDKWRYCLSWLANKHKIDFSDLLEKVADEFNEYGAEWVRYWYRLPRNTKFGWLPKTGQRKPLAPLFFSPGGVRFVPVQYRCFYAARYRELRSAPTNIKPMRISKMRP